MPTVRPITFDETAKIGVDENNNLYWNGKPVVTKRRITLPWFVNVAAVGASIATWVIAVLQTLQFFGLQPS